MIATPIQPRVLSRLAEYLTRTMPAADGATVTSSGGAKGSSVVATGDTFRDLAAAQVRLGEGPTVIAVRDGDTVVSGSLGSDPRWPRFGAAGSAAGIQSALAVPLSFDADLLGTLTVYAVSEQAFDVSAVHLGEMFAGPAAIALHTSRLWDDSRRQAERLQKMLDQPSVVDQAIGIVMSRTGLDSATARRRLSRVSRREGHDLTTTARRVVSSALRAASARQTALATQHYR